MEEINKKNDKGGTDVLKKNKWKNNKGTHKPKSKNNYRNVSKFIMKNSESLFPASTRNFMLATPEQIAEWNAERKRNYPTPENIARKHKEQERLKESGAYTTIPAINKGKTIYTELAVSTEQNFRNGNKKTVVSNKPTAVIKMVPKKLSLFEKIVYLDARDHDSLILEALTYMRKNDWLQGDMPKELIDNLKIPIAQKKEPFIPPPFSPDSSEGENDNNI